MNSDYKDASLDIIPAQPGFFLVYENSDEGKIWKGEPVVAWRIKTLQHKNGGLVSATVPLGIEGEPSIQWIGVENPDKTVTVVDDGNYASLEALQKDRYPENKLNESGLETLEALGANV